VPNYQKIMSLVEEVKDILTEKDAETKAVKKAAKKPSKHNPFKFVKKGKAIGFGPGLVRGPRKVKKKAQWRCKCTSKYNCLCIGGADGKTKKRVAIDKGYKMRYNKAYRKWRAKHPNQYAPGKGSVFRARKAQ
jgi:preprotein translocase subunit Sss1